MGATPPVKRERRGMPQWQLETPKALKRGLGSPALFGIVQGFIAASIYFALGLVIQAALGYAWIIFLVAAFFFGLVVLSYVEGASLHQERGGATIIARYAFNELASFIAGWAILLDYILLMAITAFATTDYVAVIFTPLSGGVAEFLFGAAVIVGVAWLNIRGAGSKRYERFAFVVVFDLILQTTIVILGLLIVLQPGRADQPGERGRHAVGQGPGLRVHADAGDVRGRRRLVRAGGRGGGRPQGAQAADDRAHARLHPVHRRSRWWRSARCRSPTCATAARTTTSTRRCSGSPPPSTRSGSPTCCGS